MKRTAVKLSTCTSSLRIMTPILLLTAALVQPVGAQSLTIVSPHAGEQVNSQFDDVVVHDDYSLPQPGGDRP